MGDSHENQVTLRNTEAITLDTTFSESQKTRTLGVWSVLQEVTRKCSIDRGEAAAHSSPRRLLQVSRGTRPYTGRSLISVNVSCKRVTDSSERL